MDTAGAILGPLAALAIIISIVGVSQTFSARWIEDKQHIRQSAAAIQKLPLAHLFYFAAIPGLISAWLIVKSVKEIPPGTSPSGDGANQAGLCNDRPHPHPSSLPQREREQERPSDKSVRPAILQRYPSAFWLLLLANAVFSLGNSSDAFLILRCGEMGLAFGHIILAFALYNTTYAIFSAPLGRLSDKIGRKPVIIAGWLTYAAVYGGFAVMQSPLAPWFLFATYGLYQAFSEGVSKAMVSDLVPSHQRAGAIGLFYTVSGLGQLIASIVAGLLWHVGLAGGRVMAPFAIGAVLALLASPLMAAVPIRSRSAKS
jgi:MFS family permease